MTNSKYYIDFSDSIRTLSEEVKNVKNYRKSIPKKSDIIKEFNSLEFIQNIEFGDNYFIEKEDSESQTATVKYMNKGFHSFKFNGNKKIMKVNKLDEFSSFTTSLEEELDGIKNVSSNLNTLIADLSDKLGQVDNDLKDIKISGKSIVDLTESKNILDKI